MLNVYAHPFSPFAQKVHYFVEDAGIAYKYNTVDLSKGEQNLEPFKSLNPLGQVPAIERDGFTLAESNAILRYLAQRYELSAWYPSTLEDRATVDQFMDFATLHLNRWFLTLAWNLYYGPKFMNSATDHAAVAEAQTNLRKNLEKFERHMMSGRTYIVGPTQTLADAVLLPFAASYKHAQVALGDFPATKAWIDRMSARPAWKKVQAEYEKIAGAR